MTLMDQDVESKAGLKGKHNPTRTAYRHGSQAAAIPMGNQRLAIKRSRVRSIAAHENLPLASHEMFADDDNSWK